MNQNAVDAAMTRRVAQRAACTGRIRLPAVPALVDEYIKLCADVFAASGRAFGVDDLQRARQALSDQLAEAFSRSPRSRIDIGFEAAPSMPLNYRIRQDVRTIADAYERWIGADEEPLFGAHPDARVMSLVTGLPDPASSPILDFGAGTGRNALALARLGYPVDAVEITPRFAEILRRAAAAESLRVRVIVDDVLRDRADLASNYRVLIASEVVPDFRSIADLRGLFDLATGVLCDGGLLLFNVHLCSQGFTPDRAARELSQQCYSCLFTPGEVAQAASGLPLALIADDSVHDYEKEHLPTGAFPPTAWYVNWTTGLDVYEVDTGRESCPVEMRWLVFEKQPASRARTVTELCKTATMTKTSRARHFDPTTLRRALVRRLVRRLNASGSLTLPALPGMLATYAEMGCALFRAIDRKPNAEQANTLKNHLEVVLGQAFAHSQHSNVVLTYEASFGEELRYTASPDPVPLTEAYTEWHEALGESLFGVCPDARLVTIATQMESETADPSGHPVLDIGAGLGRNAFYLGQRGYPVDAVEVTPRFSELLEAEAKRRGLPIRVIEADFVSCSQELRHDYWLVLLSGTVGDLRDLDQLQRIFQIASEVLREGGLLLMNLHISQEGYSADAAARQWAQQCRATFFARSELSRATAGLPLVLLSDESAHDYERAHLPECEWPPTPAFTEWALGQHMYALPSDQCPIELRWLLFRKERKCLLHQSE